MIITITHTEDGGVIIYVGDSIWISIRGTRIEVNREWQRGVERLEGREKERYVAKAERLLRETLSRLEAR